MARSIDEVNGGVVGALGATLADDTPIVVVVSDGRCGNELATKDSQFERVTLVQDQCFVGAAGFASDINSFLKLLHYRMNVITDRRVREKVLTADGSKREWTLPEIREIITGLLYEKRFGSYFIEVVLAGIHEGKPAIYHFDSIGHCAETSATFSGTASEQAKGAGGLLGLAPPEVLRMLEEQKLDTKLKMTEEEFKEVAATMLDLAVGRDCFSGGGTGFIYVLAGRPDGKAVAYQQTFALSD